MPLPPPSTLRFQWTPAGLNIYSLAVTLPGPLTKNVGKRVAGILAHRSGQDRLLLMGSYSGGLYNPDDDPMILPNDWVGRVDKIRALLRLSMVHRNDRQGGRFASGENNNFWQCSHCEKKLAVYCVGEVLREFGHEGDVADVTLPQLAAMRAFEWEGGWEPDFEIHITRAPCKICVKFVRLLSAITGVRMKIMTSGLIEEVFQEFHSQGGVVYEDEEGDEEDESEGDDGQLSDTDEECRNILEEAYRACGLGRAPAGNTPVPGADNGDAEDTGVKGEEDEDYKHFSVEEDSDANDVAKEGLGGPLVELDPDKPMRSMEDDEESMPDEEDTPSPSPVPVPLGLRRHIQAHQYDGSVLVRQRSLIIKPVATPIFSPPPHLFAAQESQYWEGDEGGEEDESNY